MSQKKATIGPGLIQKHLKTLAPVISQRVIIPVLAYIKLSFNEKKLTMTASNLNHFIRIETSCDSSASFEVMVPYVAFKDVCDKANGFITITVEEKTIWFTYDNSKNKVPNAVSVSDFPVIPEDEFKTTVQVDADFFYALSTADACKVKDEAMSHMCNPALDFTKGSVRTAGMSPAVGGYKEFKVESKYEGVHMVTPEFVSITKEFQETELSIGTSFIMAKYKDITVISKMSANPFVQYRTFLPSPKEPVYNLELDRKALIGALGVMSISSDKSTNQVLLTFDNGEVILKSSNDMEDTEAESRVSASKMDVPIECINLAGQYLLTILNRMQYDTIKLAIRSAKEQVFIQAEEDEDSIYYIQPLVYNN